MEETNFVIDERQPRPQMASGDDGRLIVKDSAQGDMLSMGKWMKIIGMIGMIMTGISIFLFIIALFLIIINGGAAYDYAGIGIMVFIIYILILSLGFFLSKKLYSAGKSYQNAVNNTDSAELESAIANQNVYFTIFGIITIIGVFISVFLFFYGLGGGKL